MKKILLLLCTFLCSVGMWADQFKLVTSASEIVADAKYILVSSYDGTNYVLGGTNTSNNRKAVSFESSAIDDDIITLTDIATTTNQAEKIHIIQLKTSATPGTWNILDVADNTYLNGGYGKSGGASSNNNHLKTGTVATSLDKKSVDGNFTIKIEANGYSATIKNSNGWGIFLNQNVSKGVASPLFSTYESGSYQNVYLYKYYEAPVGPVDPTITATNKTVGIEDVVDVAEMFTSNSTGAMTYSITAAPAGAVEDEDYILDGSEFYATKAGVYTVTATQAAVAGTYNSGSQTATITVSQAYTVSFGSPSNGSFVVKQGENILSSGAQVLAGTVLNLEATPAAGYMFASWSVTGATPVSETSKSTTLTVDDNVSINANFEVTTDIEITYNFNDKNNFPSGFPTGGTQTASAQRFSIGGNDLIINAPDTYYNINSTTENCGLFFGKTKNSSNKPQTGTAYLGFPAKAGYKLVKVSATSTNGIAGNLPLNVYTTSLVAVSTASNTVNGSKTTHVFEISNSEANTEYWLTAGGTSGKNLQFDNIVLIYEKVTSDEISISNVGYTTYFNSTTAYTMPSDCEGYVFTAANGLELAYEAEKVVPAGEPLVIYTVEPGTKTLNFTTSTEETYKENDMNDLEGTDAATAITPDNDYYFYGLSLNAAKETNSVGFYWMAADGAAFNNGAHKAYLKLAKNATSKSAFRFNNTTGIKTVNAEATVNKAVKRIMNGQLIIEKAGKMYNAAGAEVK